MRTLMGAAARVGPTAHAGLCAAYFGLKYRRSDPWGYETDSYERRKYAATLEAIGPAPVGRALEIGCGEGVFTRALAETGRAGEVVGIDISQRALARARDRCLHLPGVRFERRDAFAAPPPGQFDLIVCAEILYYAGGRGPALAQMLARALCAGGRVALVHPWPESDALHAPFKLTAGLAVWSDQVEHDAVRPYALTLLQRR